jgi:hypothetical protein
MPKMQQKPAPSFRQKWGIMFALIGLAVFMYVTIIYKIANYGA